MDINQEKLLSTLYKLSKGSTTTMVNLHQIQEQTEMLFPEINAALTSLKNEGMLEHSDTGDMVAISHLGVKTIQLNNNE